MNIVSIKYSNKEQTSLLVTLEDGSQYTAPWPCYTYHVDEIQTWLDNGNVIEPSFSKEELQKQVWLDIKTKRDSVQSGGFKVSVDSQDKWFHSDSSSRIQYLALINLGTNIPPNLQWKTMDGSFVTMTQELAIKVFQCAVVLDTTAFAVAEQHHEQMLLVDDPTQYDYSTNWPENYIPKE